MSAADALAERVADIFGHTMPSPAPPNIAAEEWIRWRVADRPAPWLDVYAEGLALKFGVPEIATAIRSSTRLSRDDPWSKATVQLESRANAART